MSVRLVDNKERIIVALREQVAQGINNAAQFWASEAQDLAPVDTGFLKSAIGQTVPATAAKLEAEVRSLAPYSGFVNFGTSRQPAQPFWTVAGFLTREKFEFLLKSGTVSISRGASAGRGVIQAALTEFHGVAGRRGRR